MYRIIPVENDVQGFAFVDDVFTREELDLLQQTARNATVQAVVGGDNSNIYDKDVRRSKVNWVRFLPDTAWIFEKLARSVRLLNARYYRYDIEGFGEDLQLTNYDSSDHGTYSWHIDRGGFGSQVRKMSLVLQLSEPGEYEGGELQVLETSTTPTTIEKKRGRLTIFPSHTIHRVTPVSLGNRQTLVAWLYGNPLR